MRTKFCTHGPVVYQGDGLIRNHGKQQQCHLRWWLANRCAQLLLIALGCWLFGGGAVLASPIHNQEPPNQQVFIQNTSFELGHSPARMSDARRVKVCRRQATLDPRSFTSCQYAGVYHALERKHPARVKTLAKPRNETAKDRKAAYWWTHPKAYQEMRWRNMPPREVAPQLWKSEFGWTQAQIDAAFEIIETGRLAENSSWNPCRGFGESPNVSCAQTRARNGVYVACGIPQFRPCRLLGDVLAQLRAFVRYVESPRYGEIFGALAHKRRYGWY